VASAAGVAFSRVSILGTLLIFVIAAGATPVLRRLAVDVEGIDLVGLLRVGLGLRLLAVLPRYELRQDARDYHYVGRVLADHFRSFDFNVDTGRNVPGTGSVRYLTGLIEVVTLENEFATFVVFAMFGFVGLALFIRAFSVALPELDPSRYVLLMVMWPTLIYWPSSTGKDSVMMLSLGVVAFGVAKLLQGSGGFVLVALAGLFVGGLVRPHVSLIAVTAGIAAFTLHSPSGRRTGVAARTALTGALLVAGAFASNAVERVFEIEDLNVSGLTAALDLANLRSAQGGSSFAAARIETIGDAPWGFVTVLMRPFPQEAASLPMLVTSVEGLILGALILAGLPRLAAGFRVIRQEAYLAYSIAFSLVFVYLFSALGNFGILARQRSMVIPLVLVLVSLPTPRERVRARRLAGKR